MMTGLKRRRLMPTALFALLSLPAPAWSAADTDSTAPAASTAPSVTPAPIYDEALAQRLAKACQRRDGCRIPPLLWLAPAK